MENEIYEVLCGIQEALEKIADKLDLIAFKFEEESKPNVIPA